MVEGRVSHVLPPLDGVLLARIPVPAKRTIKMYLSIVLDPSVTSRNVGIPWLTDVRGSFDTGRHFITAVSYLTSLRAAIAFTSHQK